MNNPHAQPGGNPNTALVNGDRNNTDTPIVKLPQKSRDFDHVLFDSRKWNLVMPYRHDDVIIASYPKSGTTWMQQIVRSLIRDDKNLTLDQASPWVDHRTSTDEAIIRKVVETPLTTRRFLKSHLPLDAIPTSSGDIVPAFVYIARDGRDVVWSFYNHHKSYTPGHIAAMQKGWTKEPMPDFVADNLTESQYFERWLQRDGYPLWPFFQLVRSYWEVRNHPKVLLVNYSNLIRDRAREIQRIQTFLARHGRVCVGGEGGEGDVLERAVKKSSFDAMKANGNQLAPLGGAFLQQRGDSFFNKGTNGRWRNSLPEELSRSYEEMARKELGAECAHWLATGEMR